MERLLHQDFRVFRFDEVPLNRDVFVMDEAWLSAYEEAAIAMFEGGDYPDVGRVSYFAIQKIDAQSLEAHFYPNITDRFHRVAVRIPRSAFVTCVDTPNWADKPRLFVTTNWLKRLHLKPYSAFAFVDAIGVKAALIDARFSGDAWIRLRARLDDLADTRSDVAFVSFADSLMIKTNWTVGLFNTETRYDYEPERLIELLADVDSVFHQEIGLSTYAIVTQGFNEYEDTTLVHRSRGGNHLSLNSLGVPFAQLLAIDDAVKRAVRDGRHGRSDLYLDDDVLYSLRLSSSFDRDALPRGSYFAPMTSGPSEYAVIERATLLASLRT